MTETSDDPVANWQRRIGTLRKRGRISANALTIVPSNGEVDVRAGRPAAPERLSAEEAALWERIVASRRPQWFAAAESVLESYVTATIQCQRLEAALRVRPCPLWASTQSSCGCTGRRLCCAPSWRRSCDWCLERIGRRLTKRDFTDAPVNDPDAKCYILERLLERLRAD